MTYYEKFTKTFAFLNPEYARQVLSRFYLKNNLIRVKKAPQPSDILWNGIGTLSSMKKS
jgi:hypothetical protein